MILKAIVNNQLIELNVPEDFLTAAGDFFDRMDADMDAGWQVNREWVDHPDRALRGLIVADKLLTALENDDHKLGRLMAGYIVSRFPDVESVVLNRAGEVRDHAIKLADGSTAEEAEGLQFSHSGVPAGLSQQEALVQASKDVSTVFKMGRQYRFTVYNHQSEKWEESPPVGDKEQAEALREKVFQQRVRALFKH